MTETNTITKTREGAIEAQEQAVFKTKSVSDQNH